MLTQRNINNDTMSFDLQLNVQNPDGSFASSADRPLPSGALQHLPENASAAPQGEEKVGAVEYLSNKLAQSSHPSVIIFHILFKAAALFLYIFGGWFLGGPGAYENGARFISLTVVIILLLAADFWVVKNITGRLLVGLRWWNKVENDKTTWIFESAEQQAVNAFDRSVFWTVLYATPCVWGALFVLGLLKFQVKWLLIVSMALALSIANTYGYYKCSTDQKARFQQMMQQGAQQGAVAMMRGNMLSLLTGQNVGNSNSAPSSTYV